LRTVANHRGRTHGIFCQILAGTYTVAEMVRSCGQYIYVNTHRRPKPNATFAGCRGSFCPSPRIQRSGKNAKGSGYSVSSCSIALMYISTANTTNKEPLYIPLVGEDDSPSGDQISVVLVIFIQHMWSSWNISP
jgi:hypothetical protein